MMTENTIPALLKARAAKTPHEVAHCSLDDAGGWQGTSWEQYLSRVAKLSSALLSSGLQRGQRVAFMATTSQKWEMMQMAVLGAGGVVVGVDPHDAAENIALIIQRAAPTGLVVQNVEILAAISQCNIERSDFVVVLEPGDFLPAGCSSYTELAATPANTDAAVFDLVRGEDPATIIFTSGTTGKPKGLLYTHGQVTAACQAIMATYDDVREGGNLVCWLPLSNLFQRMMNYCAMAVGATTYFIENPREVIRYLPAIAPRVFIGVPRFYEKLYAGLMAELESRSLPVRFFCRLAIRIGDRYARCCRNQASSPFWLASLFRAADRLVLKRLRRMFGPELLFMVSGSAPMPPWLLERYHAFGVLILEAYGISENIVPIAANTPDTYKFGTVGQVLPANQVRLSPEGEVLVRGPGVCRHYLGDAEEQPAPNGEFLSTGDLAVIDERGFMTLIGRKSEIFKTSTGRRIAPAGIESRIGKISYVEHVVVVGAGHKALLAIVSVAVEKMAGERAAEGLSKDHLRQLAGDVQREVVDLPPFQRPAAVAVTTRQFSVAGGELTANLKLRRRYIAEIYAGEIEKIYATLDDMPSADNQMRSFCL